MGIRKVFREVSVRQFLKQKKRYFQWTLRTLKKEEGDEKMEKSIEEINFILEKLKEYDTKRQTTT